MVAYPGCAHRRLPVEVLFDTGELLEALADDRLTLFGAVFERLADFAQFAFEHLRLALTHSLAKVELTLNQLGYRYPQHGPFEKVLAALMEKYEERKVDSSSSPSAC